MSLSVVSSQLKAELRAFVSPGPRMIDEIECVAAILLAILLAHLIGAKAVSWAAFTSFVLMRGHVSETLLRGLMRIVGTIAGGALALLIVPYAIRSLPLVTLAAGIVGAVGLYGMLTAKRAYAWLLFGLTFEMILLDKVETPTVDTIAFFQTRLLEVTAGTIACVTVSLASTLSVRRRWPAKLSPPSIRVGWHPGAARHAAQAGMTLALIPALHTLFPIPALQQAGVTVMAVMIVPVSNLARGGLAPVTERLIHRTIGCLGGGLLAGTVLFAAQGSAPLLIAGTCLGIIISRHVENSGTHPYIGLQFALVILVTLIPDNYANVAIRPALDRLASILIGMALLEPVLLFWHFIVPIGRFDHFVGDASGSE